MRCRPFLLMLILGSSQEATTNSFGNQPPSPKQRQGSGDAGILPGEERLNRASQSTISGKFRQANEPPIGARAPKQRVDVKDDSMASEQFDKSLTVRFQTNKLTPALLNVIARDAFAAKVESVLGDRWIGRTTPESLVRMMQLEIIPGKVATPKSKSPPPPPIPPQKKPGEGEPIAQKRRRELVEPFTPRTATLLLRQQFDDVTFVEMDEKGIAKAVAPEKTEEKLRSLGFFGGRLYAAPPPGAEIDPKGPPKAGVIDPPEIRKMPEEGVRKKFGEAKK